MKVRLAVSEERHRDRILSGGVEEVYPDGEEPVKVYDAAGKLLGEIG